MPILKRDSCAPHSDNPGAELYDSNGKPCSTLSQSDKIIIAAAAGACGITLLVLGLIYLRRLRKSRAQDRVLASEGLMSSLDAPLIFRVSSRAASVRTANTGQMYEKPAWSDDPQPVSPSAPYSPYLSSPSASSSSHSSRSHTPSQGNFALGSGSSSDHSHLPILSADGHLLPVSPPLHQANQEPTWTYGNSSPYDEYTEQEGSGRSEESHYSKRSLPQVPQVAQMGYVPQPSQGVVGMYPELEQDIGYAGVRGLYGYPEERAHGYAPVGGYTPYGR